MTEIFHLSGMKSFRDDLIDRMKTGWGRFVLASISLYSVTSLYGASIVLYLYAGGGWVNPYVWHFGIFCWGPIEMWDILYQGVIKQGCNVEDHE